ncbi:hypothetical protein BU26DRAFT_533212 [Trematosphaeria pertusa]|uniref:Protein kinase domain-containing protein n=1 Tax=Trematosphaeria pertusa TaxID=390896 RepID=A0A6A6I3M5_9PLEO|nr:uncharacterized protein BU26DRAFT_533212 [Trematosphaeria pertusa]KAF2245095.1 hypothetical protein BU26DRAFT_533212 [Trematosphaeria pertusa]
MNDSPYQKLVLQARDEEQQRRRSAELAREEEQQRRRSAELARDKEQAKNRNTTLPEYLDALHTHLHCGLSVNEKSMSTQGDPSNAKKKARPDRLRLWTDFPTLQIAIWDTLVKSEFIHARQFQSTVTLQQNGEMVRRRMMSSELDLHYFERLTVHEHVSLIVSKLYEQDEELRQAFKLEGSVDFENHANTLSSAPELDQSGPRPSHSALIRARGQSFDSQPPATPTPASTPTPTLRPLADQFCVYNSGAHKRIPALIMEYKPPHKLTLGTIYEGLEEFNLEDVQLKGKNEEPKQRQRRLVAATITQVFSYMIRSGLEFGCVCIGEATIFLRVPEEDPSTVYFYLSVPKGDVGDSTGWTTDGDQDNRLHLTAVGQMLAFTLQSLRKVQRPNDWRASALKQLQTWDIVYNEFVAAVPKGTEAPSSEYRPSRQLGFLRASPIRLRPRRGALVRRSCGSNDPSALGDSDQSGSDSETPSRRARPPPSSRAVELPLRAAASSSSKKTTTSGDRAGQQYCTQECLRGLLDGGPLDKSCPNIDQHGYDHHQIDAAAFCTLMQQQLAECMDTNFEVIGRCGSRGVPFRVRLASYGYILVAKCTPPDFVHHLQHEAAVYDRLRPIQGLFVPVHIGNINLVRPVYYEGIAELTYVMFLSFGGMPISRQITTDNRAQITEQALSCVRAIHSLDVLHRDIANRNILRDVSIGRTMVIDFERSELRPPRPVLGPVSPNWKRKRDKGGVGKTRQGVADPYSGEREEVTWELSRLTV